MKFKSTTLSEVERIILRSPCTISTVCRLTGKWGMYVSLRWVRWPDVHSEYILAAPYLGDAGNEHVLSNGYGFFLFDTKKEMQAAFDMTVGPSGKAKNNKYDGPAKVYALTCDTTGREIDENS